MIASAPSQPSAASAARILGTMPPAIVPALDERLGLARGQAVEPAAVGVADAVDVGQQDELAGAEPGGDPGRGVVRVDVADDPLLVAGERRDDRHLAADEERVEQVAAEPDDVGDEPHPRDPLGDEQAAVDARTARPRRRPRSRRPATSSLLTTPRRTAAATSSEAASVTRRPPSNVDGTPSRSSHSVIRLPPPWTSTTGRWRAIAATSLEHLPLLGDRRAAELDDEDLAHRSAPRRRMPAFTSCTPRSRSRRPR